MIALIDVILDSVNVYTTAGIVIDDANRARKDSDSSDSDGSNEQLQMYNS